MNKNYEFEDEYVEKVLDILSPNFAVIESELKELDEELDLFSLNSKKIKEIISNLNNIEYLDEFEKFKDSWDEYTSKFYMEVMETQLKDGLGKPYKIFLAFYEVDELIKQFELAVKMMQESIKNKNQVYSDEEYKKFLIQQSNSYHNSAIELASQDKIFDNFINFAKDHKFGLNYEDDEDQTYELLCFLEEEFGSGEFENELFWQNKEIKIVYEHLARSLANLSFANFINEQNWNEEIVGE